MSLFRKPNVEKMKIKRDEWGLVGALLSQKDASIRAAAEEALGEIGAPVVKRLVDELVVIGRLYSRFAHLIARFEKCGKLSA